MINKLFCLKQGFFKSIIDFFFPPIETKLGGRLVVSGAGFLEFKFKQHPADVFVYFHDETDPNPCDPGSDDLLSWQMVHDDCHHTLMIEWSVQSARTIIWKVCL